MTYILNKIRSSTNLSANISSALKTGYTQITRKSEGVSSYVNSMASKVTDISQKALSYVVVSGAPQWEEEEEELEVSTLTDLSLYSKSKIFFTQGLIGRKIVEGTAKFAVEYVGATVGYKLYEHAVSHSDGIGAEHVAQCAMMILPTLYLAYRITSQRSHQWTWMNAAVMAGSVATSYIAPSLVQQVGLSSMHAFGKTTTMVLGGYAALKAAQYPVEPLIDLQAPKKSFLVTRGFAYGVPQAFFEAKAALKFVRLGSAYSALAYTAPTLITHKDMLVPAKLKRNLQSLHIHGLIDRTVMSGLSYNGGLLASQTAVSSKTPDSNYGLYLASLVSDLQQVAGLFRDVYPSNMIRSFNLLMDVVQNSEEVHLAFQSYLANPSSLDSKYLLAGAISKALNIPIPFLEIASDRLDQQLLQLPKFILNAERKLFGFELSSENDLIFLKDMIGLFALTYLPALGSEFLEYKGLTTEAEELKCEQNLVGLAFTYLKMRAPSCMGGVVAMAQTSVLKALELKQAMVPIQIESKSQPDSKIYQRVSRATRFGAFIVKSLLKVYATTNILVSKLVSWISYPFKLIARSVPVDKTLIFVARAYNSIKSIFVKTKTEV